jgi:preprotein translocase subunit YajC
MFTALCLLAQKEGEGPPSWTTFVPLVVMFVLFYFLIILPARRREKQQRNELFTNLKKNDEVLTSAGIIGIVANIKDDEVTLKIDDTSNAKLRVLKSSLVRIMNPKEPTAGSENIKAGAPAAK